MQIKRGFILIYTILIGIIGLSIMMYIFDIGLAEVKYSSSSKRYSLKEDSYQRRIEYLLTLFSTYINTNKLQIKTLGINNYFGNLAGNIVSFEKAKVTYSNTSYQFNFTTPYDSFTNRNDYYKLEFVGEDFKRTFVKTDYTNK